MIKDIEKVIRTRKSVRTFVEIDIEPEKKQRIIDFMHAHSVGLFGNKVQFFWIDGDSDEYKNVKLGTYGVISGTKNFIAGKIKATGMNFEDFGYCMEKLVLFCAEIEIGTCWLGGTYKKTAFAVATDLHDDEFVPAVLPVGYIAEKKRIVDTMFRRMAGSDNRKPFDELFSSERYLQPLTVEEKSTYGFFLEMLRLAPSASNKQPWRIVLVGKKFHFYLKRTPNYDNKFIQSDLQRVDMGIGMSHFELALNEKNVLHKWTIENPHLKTDEFTEYIASCELL